MKQKIGKNIPSAGPSISNLEIELVTEAVTHGWYENRNMHINQFLNEFSSYLGMKYGHPTCNCTSALHLAMLGLGIGPGDEVIVPEITWVASAEPIVYVGATPIFADVNKENWCLSPNSFKQMITKKTKAVVVVDTYGNMPEMDEIIQIAQHNNMYIIEDAAEAIGAEYNKKKAGSFGDVSVFSFNATKLMMAGQGGMIVTNNKKLIDKCKKLSHHGMPPYSLTKTYWSEEIGYNYDWSNLQAALALAQFRRLNELVERKRLVFKWYKNRLNEIEGIQLNSEAKNVKNTFWIVTAIIDSKYGFKKEDLMKESRKYNIDTRPFFYPISSMPPYKKYCKNRNMKELNPVSYEISPYGICLPSAMSITEEDVDQVCNWLKKTILN